MDSLEFIETTLVDWAKRMPLEEAASQLIQFGPDRKELVEKALSKIKEAAARIRTLKRPRSFGQGGEPWYVGPTENDIMWPSYMRVLIDGRWSEEDIGSLDASSSKILSFLQPPGAGLIDTRGLVIGYVQSGKTSNYTGLIAKAADVGYRFFIVLTGTIEALRQQTQERLENDLINRQAAHWVQLTRLQTDFDQHVNVNAFLADHRDQFSIAVVKKNGPILRRLLTWVRGARVEILRSCPVLVIDDEADLASINTSNGNVRTTINRLILDLLSVLPKAAYVGFTATPFANVLIDPTDRDLYPKDFIVDLPRPKAYFGPEKVFGRDRLSPDESDDVTDGLDVIRTIYDKEVGRLKPPGAQQRYSFVPTMVPTLRRACLYFWMATAARRVRGQVDEHSTMLIHTSMYAGVHQGFQQPIESLKACTLEAISTRDEVSVRKLRHLWQEEQCRVGLQDSSETTVPFESLLPHLAAVVQSTEFKVENSFSLNRLDYSTPGRIYIVVGGNVLSRGLTLRGLVVSYFVRTASAYDTLLQMGRWFGYRQGYSDLPRIWMTDELKGYFYDLATVEKEIRNDIEVYEREKLTPVQFAVRIRTHPDLSITSPMKMRNAIDAEMSYSGRRPQTFLFRHRDHSWLQNNIQACKGLFAAIRQEGIEKDNPKDIASFVYRNVDYRHILRFIENYSFHEKNLTLRPTLLRKYIEAQVKLSKPELLSWNVGVVSVRSGKVGTIDLGTGDEVNLLNRARIKMGKSDPSTADLKAIMSNADIVLDLRDGNVDTASESDKLIEYRTESLPGVGLLLVYPISKDSKAGDPPRDRANLDAVDDIVGVAFVFPTSASDTPQKYKSARIPETQVIEEIENVEAVAEI